MRLLSILLLPVLLLVGCSHSAVRYEFYRAEIKYQHQQGNQLYKKGDYAAAAEHYQQILDYMPDYVDARVSLANVALAQGRVESAIKQYQQAVASKPELAPLVENYIAYGMTLPKTEQNYSLASLSKAAVAAKNGDLTALIQFSEQLTDVAAWVANQRKLFSEMSLAISADLYAAYVNGNLKSCQPCFLFTAQWFADVALARHYPIILQVIEQENGTAMAITLAYKLGLAYERDGDRVAAMNIYLRYPNDSRIQARLK